MRYNVGIDVGTHTTRVVVAEPSARSGGLPRIVATGISETVGMRHGYVTHSGEVTKSVRVAVMKAEKALGSRIKHAYISIGGISIASEIARGSSVIAKADGEITDRDVQKAILQAEHSVISQSKNKKIVHSVPQTFSLDGKEVLGNPTGLKGVKLEIKVLFITCLEHHFEDLVTAVSDAGITITDVVAAPIAASLATLSERQKMVGCVLVDIGAETVSMAVFENSTVISLQVFSIGSTDITNDIALGFRIPLDEAEDIKIGTESEHSKKKVDEIIEARLSDIFELIQNSLKKIKRNGLLPAGVIITGGGSGLATIQDFARATLKLPSKVMNVQHVQNTSRKMGDSSWFIAYGLCYPGRAGT